MEFEITADAPDAPDVAELIATHLAFSREASGPGNSFALETEALADPAVTFYSCRTGDDERLLLGVGALKTIDAATGEVKSMHTASAARGFGIGRALLAHLLDAAQQRGMARVNLETGTMDEFAPARALYHSVGFEDCPPFGDYTANEASVCMTIELEPPAAVPMITESDLTEVTEVNNDSDSDQPGESGESGESRSDHPGGTDG